jgi:hypothetical protein
VLANNAVRLAEALDDSRLLAGAGIPVLFIKGAALIAATGRLGLRRNVDVAGRPCPVLRCDVSPRAGARSKAAPDVALLVI